MSRLWGKWFQGGIIDCIPQDPNSDMENSTRNVLGSISGMRPVEGKGMRRNWAEGEVEKQCSLKGGFSQVCREMWDHDDPLEFFRVGARVLALYNPWLTSHCICTTSGRGMTLGKCLSFTQEFLKRNYN